MDAFDGAGERERRADLAAARFGRGQAEDRPQAFPAGEQAVTHRLVDRRRWGRCLGQEAIEGAVDFLLAGDEIRLQVH